MPPFESYAAHKEAQRLSKAADSAVPASDNKPPVDKTAPAPDKADTPAPSEKTERDAPPADKPAAKPALKSETADAPGARNKDTQQPTEKKRDRTAAGRARELMLEGRVDEAEKILRDAGKADRDKFEAAARTERERADKLDEELRELRTRKPAVEEAKPAPVKSELAKADPPKAEKPKADAAAATFPEPRPLLEQYIAKASADNPELSYEQLQDKFWLEVVEPWTDRRDQWREGERARQAQAKTETSKQETEQYARKQRHDEQMAAAKVKYPTFERELKAVIAAHPDLSNEGIGAAFGTVPDTAEVLYALSKNNGAEYLRIAKLSPAQAYYETVKLAISLDQSSPADEDPDPPPPPAAERNRPAVTRVPRPYVPVSGAETPVSKAPQNYQEHKNRAR